MARDNARSVPWWRWCACVLLAVCACWRCSSWAWPTWSPWSRRAIGWLPFTNKGHGQFTPVENSMILAVTTQALSRPPHDGGIVTGFSLRKSNG